MTSSIKSVTSSEGSTHVNPVRQESPNISKQINLVVLSLLSSCQDFMTVALEDKSTNIYSRVIFVALPFFRLHQPLSVPSSCSFI